VPLGLVTVSSTNPARLRHNHQVLAWAREFLPDPERLNPVGGAIALGHPLGASGARLALTAALELKRRQAHFALCTMCIGVGQGIALLLERV
jgi:acetyl-CoA acyltransferase